MAVPRGKVSPSRRGKRRSGHTNPRGLWTEDKKSGELHRPHHMIAATGEWRGRIIMPPKVKAEKPNEAGE